ncbi:MAG: DegT/DnrJ/EryC1/StrS family aminotransferase [Deltaproteobacteria bacterium]|nr:DegT/DnrJ/EryC1/StrS family aminotransferase [Deltaproteobacteria bacterium]
MKTSVTDLAIFGGTPGLPEKLHVGRPNIGDRRKLDERLREVLDSRWFSNDGPFLRRFEEALAAALGVRHCVAVCNATIGLEIAARVLGLRGEVIVPSFTFVATAHALQWLGITPVFCDVNERTHAIDPTQIESLVTSRTSGIVGVHVWGEPCPVDEVGAIAARRGLRVIYDAAHAVACSYRGRMLGGEGDIEVFSFHATKFLNSFEGGALTTNHDELARQARLMRNFGFTGYDQVESVGTNGKMTEVCAAMGLTSLESLDWLVECNRANYDLYRQHLDGVPGLRVYPYDRTEKRNFQYVVLEVEPTRAGVSRDDLHRILQAENVLARRYFYPGCHRMEPYRSADPKASARLPATERVTARVLSVPTGPNVSPERVVEVCELIRLVMANQTEVVARLSGARPVCAS